MSAYHLVPLTEEHARAIMSWRYPPPYDFYDPPADDYQEEYVKEFLNPELAFHAVLDADGRFIGFCSYGIDGQVPGGEYRAGALDIGLGMKPELTGEGRGSDFFAAVLAFAQERFNANAVRVTVATFNERALNLYRNFGFRQCGEFEDARFNVPYVILLKD